MISFVMTSAFMSSAYAEVSLPSQLILKHDLEFQAEVPLASLQITDDDVRQSSLNKIVGQCFLTLKEEASIPLNKKISANTALTPSHVEYSKDFKTAFHLIGRMFTLTFWAIFLPRNYQVAVMLNDDVFATIQCNFGVDGTDNVDLDRLVSKMLERNFIFR